LVAKRADRLARNDAVTKLPDPPAFAQQRDPPRR